MASSLDFWRQGAARGARSFGGGGAAGKLVRTVELAAGAFGASALSARLGGPEGKDYFGIPVEVIAGGALMGLGLAGVAGEFSDDAMALGEGALAGWAAQFGRKLGAKGVSVSGEYELGYGDDPDRLLRFAGM